MTRVNYRLLWKKSHFVRIAFVTVNKLKTTRIMKCKLEILQIPETQLLESKLKYCNLIFNFNQYNHADFKPETQPIISNVSSFKT